MTEPSKKRRIELAQVKPTFTITYNSIVKQVDTIDADEQNQMLDLCDALFDPKAQMASIITNAKEFHDCVQAHSEKAGIPNLYEHITEIIIKKHCIDGTDQRVSFDIQDNNLTADGVSKSKIAITEGEEFANVATEHVDFRGPLENAKRSCAFSFNLWRDANDAPLGTYYRDVRTFTSAFPINAVLKEPDGKPNYKFESDEPVLQSSKGQIIPVVTMPHRAPSAQELQQAMRKNNVEARYNVIVLVQYPQLFTVTDDGNPSIFRTNLRF